MSDTTIRNLRVLAGVGVILFLGALCYFLPTLTSFVRGIGAKPSAEVQTSQTKVTHATIPPKATATPAARTTPNGELIGISDGTFVFDTSETSRSSKLAAAEKLKAGDSAAASQFWEQAMHDDSSDAEAHIYRENQRVLDSHQPYITMVVATILSGSNSGVGRSNLQGAYVAQKEYNDCLEAAQGNTQCPNLGAHWHVRLLIANSGSRKEDAAEVAKQIVQLAQEDKTFVGVMGWPLSDSTLQALPILTAANIPMVSSASSDDLTGKAPHFFRVSVPASQQAIIAAQYAEQTLNANNVWLFMDDNDSYSNSLAQAFYKRFRDGGNKVYTAHYTRKNPQSIENAIEDSKQHSPSPNLVYFAGYSDDVNALLKRLPDQNLLVLGPNSLYELGGYQDKTFIPRIRLTAFAYPDEWKVLGYTEKTPTFFDDYQKSFDPDNTHSGTYGYGRADADVIMAYDATKVILTASGKRLAYGDSNVTPQHLQDELAVITREQPFQGVSGQISFDADGNATNKELLILCTVRNPDNGGTFHLAQAQGQFLVGSTVQIRPNLTDKCK